MEDIRKERELVSSKMDELSEKLMAAGKRAIEEEGELDPVVAVVYLDGRVEFLYPKFTNQEARVEAFDKVNKFIRDTDGAGVVLLVDTIFEPRQGGESLEALLTQKRSIWIKEFHGFVYVRGKDGRFKEWKEEVGPAPILRDNLITVFRDAS